uniref:magnesium transporter n=1 Tax=Ndongobacter massiliensis TaxID=1871025 RepID=UPI000930A958|nr:magnesium transporter [Ndongobacter massiliensis]
MQEITNRSTAEAVLSSVREAIEARNVLQVREQVEHLHAADAAELMELLNSEECMVLFRFLQKDYAAELFSFLSIEQQKALIRGFNDEELLELVDRLFIDDATDLLEELPANAVRRILSGSSQVKRTTLNRYLRFPEDSAGSAMSEEFIRLQPEMTVAHAIRKIRNHRKKLASTSVLYVTENDQKLVGVLSIRELLQAKDETTVGEIMHDQVVYVLTTTDREEALALIRKYDFLALPVTDREERLVGVITIDDALDISDEEATEDFEKMAAMHPSERPYFESGVVEQAKSRLPWLFILMISGMLTGFILEGFEDAFKVMPILVTFIPMLTDTGGNAGSQSSTMIIRGLALGEIKVHQLPQVIWKELRISVLVGIGLAIVCMIRVLLINPDQYGVALAVSSAVFFIVMISKMIGGALPLLAKKIGLDPALMAAPLITTLVDAAGLLIFFSLAELILGL